MELGQIIERLRPLKDELHANGVEHLAIFGSRARRDHRKESDLDILVDVPWRAKFSRLDLVGLEQTVSETTAIAANAFMRRSLESDFLSSIKNDIVEVF